jgi:type IV secretory pathway VirB10-like protein
MNPVFTDQLVAMGFDLASATAAVNATNGTSLDAAIDFLLSHTAPAPVHAPAPVVAPVVTAAPSYTAPAPAQRSTEAAPATAAATAPAMTAADLQDRIARRRAERALEEKKADQERERQRVEDGKKMAETRRELDEQQRKLEREAERRQKTKDDRYRKELLASIAREKEIRRGHGGRLVTTGLDTVADTTIAGQGMAGHAGHAMISPAMIFHGGGAPATAAIPAPVASETRIALQIPGKPRQIKKFSSHATLAELYAWARQAVGTDLFELYSGVPRRMLARSAAETLADAGLCPSAAIILTMN